MSDVPTFRLDDWSICRRAVLPSPRGLGASSHRIYGVSEIKVARVPDCARLHVGANWDNGSHCGSRSVNVNNFPSNVNSNNAARGAAGPRMSQGWTPMPVVDSRILSPYGTRRGRHVPLDEQSLLAKVRLVEGSKGAGKKALP